MNVRAAEKSDTAAVSVISKTTWLGSIGLRESSSRMKDSRWASLMLTPDRLIENL
jgi:hypothetical protein